MQRKLNLECEEACGGLLIEEGTYSRGGNQWAITGNVVEGEGLGCRSN